MQGGNNLVHVVSDEAKASVLKRRKEIRKKKSRKVHRTKEKKPKGDKS